MWNRVHLLYFSRDYTTHDHRFLSALAKTEHKVSYLRLENAGQTYESRSLPPEIRQIPWVGGQTTARFRDGLRLVRGLRSVLRQENPDVVLAGPIQRSAFLTALVGFRPLISMSWGYDLLHDVNQNRWWRWATRYTLQRSAAMVGDCDTIRNLAVQHGMAKDRIVTFPWGADIRTYTPARVLKHETALRQRKGWGADTIVLLSTRSWSPLYGVEDLARAFVRAARQRPELRLFMLGGGPLSSTIKRIIQSANMLDRVHFPGQINQNELPAYYQAADLYISTSHSDGTSISLLEALASGTPVLLTDIPGNLEWVPEQGRVGWTFPDGDASALEKAILHAVQQQDRLSTMGRAARQLAEERGDWHKNFPKLQDAFEIVQR